MEKVREDLSEDEEIEGKRGGLFYVCQHSNKSLGEENRRCRVGHHT